MMWSCGTANATPPLDWLILGLFRLSPRMILDDILVPATWSEIDDSFFFELSHNFDNPRLSRVHVFDFLGAQQIHFFLHHFNCSSRHVVEELGLLLIRRTFQCLPDCFLVDALEDF